MRCSDGGDDDEQCGGLLLRGTRSWAFPWEAARVPVRSLRDSSEKANRRPQASRVLISGFKAMPTQTGTSWAGSASAGPYGFSGFLIRMAPQSCSRDMRRISPKSPKCLHCGAAAQALLLPSGPQPEGRECRKDFWAGLFVAAFCPPSPCRPPQIPGPREPTGASAFLP